MTQNSTLSGYRFIIPNTAYSSKAFAVVIIESKPDFGFRNSNRAQLIVIIAFVIMDAPRDLRQQRKLINPFSRSILIVVYIPPFFIITISRPDRERIGTYYDSILYQPPNACGL